MNKLITTPPVGGHVKQLHETNDSEVDELHVLHPLIASATWIFGPEDDSPEYSSNSQLQIAVEKLFGKEIDKSVFINHKKRPDIVVLLNLILSATAALEYNNENGLTISK